MCVRHELDGSSAVVAVSLQDFEGEPPAPAVLFRSNRKISSLRMVRILRVIVLKMKRERESACVLLGLVVWKAGAWTVGCLGMLNYCG